MMLEYEIICLDGSTLKVTDRAGSTCAQLRGVTFKNINEVYRLIRAGQKAMAEERKAR